MSFPPQFLDEIKSRIAVSDIVGRRVKLTRRGREYVGLSPFKQEKTPSFTVNDAKQFYHCFSTGKHGTVFDFLMETEGLSFPEAVEKLAQQAGLPMPQKDPKAREKMAKEKSLIEVCELAQDWFTSQLMTTQAESARHYLAQRGVDEHMIANFGIGYAADHRQALINHLASKNITPEQMRAAGLVIKPDEGLPYDRFRHRIMFPIHNRNGRVIAFGGRAMAADAPAKYINSPETEIFHKGHILYNFAKARQAAYEQKQLLVVEGYMDVVGLARAGIDHAVAPLGTAVTEQQINLLWRLAPEPILCLDGDVAGLRAAYRALDRALPLLNPGFSLHFALLPEGQDPDDVVREGGKTAFDQLLAQPYSLADMLWEREVTAAPWDTPERRAALKQRLRQAVGQIQNRDIQHLYGEEIARRLDTLFTPAPRGGSNNQQALNRRFRNQNIYPSREARRHDLARGNAALPPREVLMLAYVLADPTLLTDHSDLFESIEFSINEFTLLQDEIINLYIAYETLDNLSLKGHLEARNFGSVVNKIMAVAKQHGLEIYKSARALAQNHEHDIAQAVSANIAEENASSSVMRSSLDAPSPISGDAAGLEEPVSRTEDEKPSEEIWLEAVHLHYHAATLEKEKSEARHGFHADMTDDELEREVERIKALQREQAL